MNPAIPYTIEGHVAVITMNNPPANTWTRDSLDALADLIKQFNANKDIYSLVITGEGEKFFSAGADLKLFATGDKQVAADMSTAFGRAFEVLSQFRGLSIAAINGFALGGGLELAMSCHIRVASTNAKMGLPEVSLGVIPGYGGTQRLRELVGKGKALEMITSAAMLSAEEAKEWGLVNHVCEQEELMALCEKIAGRIIKNSPIAISKAIKSVNAGCNTDGYEAEKQAFGECFATDDFKEGTSAFMEKRKPNFTGK